MSDEQIIYLSPEEEVTNVRERLEQIPTRRVILVIPAQTQLRSHVSWRLLHARARELGKDVLIVSADRQIRSVVKAAGFRVADSLESPHTNRSRPAPRPGRSGFGGKSAPNQRMPQGRATSTSTAFQAKGGPYGPNYDFRIGQAPLPAENVPAPIRPIAPAEDEEPDLLLEDFRYTQSIRQAAQPNEAGIASPPLAEQQSSGSIDEVDDGVPDITVESPHVLSAGDIEDQGDMGDFVIRPDTVPHSGSERPRYDFGGEDELPPVNDPSARASEPTSSRQSRIFPTARRGGDLRGRSDTPQPVTFPKSRPTQPKASGALDGLSADKGGRGQVGGKGEPNKKKQTGNTRSGAPSPSRRKPGVTQPQRLVFGLRQQQKNSGSNGIVVPILVGVLTLLVIGLLAYLVPSADITLKLAAQPFEVPMHLTATATSHQDVIHNTLSAQKLVFDTSVEGTGHATGITQVGTVHAKGSVVFTNKGTSSLIIPTGTIVATPGGVQFATLAEVFVVPGNIQPLPTPVQAQNPGLSGNVPANSITVIPPESLSIIQQANPGLTVNLSVINSDHTSGGGVGNAKVVANIDITTEKAALDAQIQVQVQVWLKKQLQSSNDQQGIPVQLETPIVTPALGTMVPDGTFSETLNLHMTILVVRAAELQKAAIAQLTTALRKHNPGFTLVPQETVQLTQIVKKPATDGSSLELSFTASGLVAANITEDTVRNMVAGKTIDDAQHYLKDSSRIPGVLDVQITAFPGFIHWIPSLLQRINVHFKTVEMIPTPQKKAQ